MNSEQKCVMVVDEKMPLGIIANCTAVMGVTVGKLFPEVVGRNVVDQTGHEHQGVIEFPIPILKGNKDFLRELKEKTQEPCFEQLTVVDFFDAAQSCKTYDEYIEKMKEIPEAKLQYFGLTFFGPKKQVNQLTGSLPLLR